MEFRFGDLTFFKKNDVYCSYFFTKNGESDSRTSAKTALGIEKTMLCAVSVLMTASIFETGTKGRCL